MPEFVESDRLPHIIEGAEMKSPGDMVKIRCRAVHDHSDTDIVVVDVFHDLVAVDTRHGDVQQHQVETALLEGLDGSFPAASGDHRVTCLFQFQPAGAEPVGIIIDNEDLVVLGHGPFIPCIPADPESRGLQWLACLFPA